MRILILISAVVVLSSSSSINCCRLNSIQNATVGYSVTLEFKIGHHSAQEIGIFRSRLGRPLELLWENMKFEMDSYSTQYSALVENEIFKFRINRVSCAHLSYIYVCRRLLDGNILGLLELKTSPQVTKACDLKPQLTVFNATLGSSISLHVNIGKRMKIYWEAFLPNSYYTILGNSQLSRSSYTVSTNATQSTLNLRYITGESYYACFSITKSGIVKLGYFYVCVEKSTTNSNTSTRTINISSLCILLSFTFNVFYYFFI